VFSDFLPRFWYIEWFYIKQVNYYYFRYSCKVLVLYKTSKLLLLQVFLEDIQMDSNPWDPNTEFYGYSLDVSLDVVQFKPKVSKSPRQLKALKVSLQPACYVYLKTEQKVFRKSMSFGPSSSFRNQVLGMGYRLLWSLLSLIETVI